MKHVRWVLAFPPPQVVSTDHGASRSCDALSHPLTPCSLFLAADVCVLLVPEDMTRDFVTPLPSACETSRLKKSYGKHLL